MKCPNCQFENPEGAKFCGDCGAKMESLCPKCKSPNPLQFKFCGECGHALSLPSNPAPKELSFDEKLRKTQKYLPSGLTEKILSQRDKIEGKRKLVTVMLTDMEGFTPLVEKLGPEEAYAIMDQVYEILIHKVHEYEGTVNEMTGDGFMALFGASIALEDAPQRAIRYALAIHREITRFNDRMKQRYSPPPLMGGEGEGGGERKEEWRLCGIGLPAGKGGRSGEDPNLGREGHPDFPAVPYMPGVWEFQVNRLDREFAEDYDAYYAFQAKEGKTYFYK
jgi:hypothetical protein